MEGGPIKPPVQREDLDLSQRPNGNPHIENPARLPHWGTDYRSPADMMRSMGFDPNSTMTPLQFLVAVYNDDLDKVFRNEKRRDRMKAKGGIAMSYRTEAAKTAAKYMHMQMPQVAVTKDERSTFGAELAAGIAKGGDRIRTKRVILETVERISPELPLPPAQYPPGYEGVIDAQIVEMAEGDTNYDPDNE